MPSFGVIQVRISDPRSLGSRCNCNHSGFIGSFLPSFLPLMHHDPNDLGSLILISIVTQIEISSQRNAPKDYILCSVQFSLYIKNIFSHSKVSKTKVCKSIPVLKLTSSSLSMIACGRRHFLAFPSQPGT